VKKRIKYLRIICTKKENQTFELLYIYYKGNMTGVMYTVWKFTSRRTIFLSAMWNESNSFGYYSKPPSFTDERQLVTRTTSTL